MIMEVDNTDFDRNTDCVICYNPLLNNTITLSCNHTFHNSCMNTWKNYQNSCPYCRHNLNEDRIPASQFDDYIQQDGNIDGLNEHNFRHFYYINEDAYNREQILYYIDRIKIAKELKSSLQIFENYNISPVYEFESNFGKLIKINKIDSFGTFSCHFQTEKGLKIYYSNIHQFTLSNS